MSSMIEDMIVDNFFYLFPLQFSVHRWVKVFYFDFFDCFTFFVCPYFVPYLNPQRKDTLRVTYRKCTACIAALWFHPYFWVFPDLSIHGNKYFKSK